MGFIIQITYVFHISKLLKQNHLLFNYLWNSKIYKGDPRPRIPSRVMASSAMGLKLGSSGFLPTTHTKTNAIQMHPRSSHAVQRFMCVYIHAQTAVDAGDIRTWRITVILITGITQRPPIWAPCRDKNGAGFGISLEYLWWNCISLYCLNAAVHCNKIS